MRWAESSSQTRARRSIGQGFGLTPPERRAVDRHAMQRSMAYFVARGFEVFDVSADHPFDLLCRRDNEEVHAEVKGTTGAGVSVLLTHNEVAHARLHKEQMALVIVSQIQLDCSGDEPTASSGRIRVLLPWHVDSGTLKPTQYQYRPSEL